MSSLALLLVLLSAVAHVYWNFEVKRSPHPAVCGWWVMTLGAILGLPLALVFVRPFHVPPLGWICVVGTGLLYAAYFTLIAASYRREDLSRAYPIARGVAPLATALWGVLFLNEHPTLAGWGGILAIAAGVLILALWTKGGGLSVSRTGVLAAIGTGLCVSGYSAVDKVGVKLVHPLLYITLTFAAGSLAQLALLKWGDSLGKIGKEARERWPQLLAAGIASMGGYLLVLLVFQWEPVSYVVPVRSVAVLLSVLAGARLLGEGGTASRLAAAVLVLGGIALIAVWGR